MLGLVLLFPEVRFILQWFQPNLNISSKLKSNFDYNWQFGLSNFAKTEVLPIWYCQKSIIFNLGYFEMCHFQVIWCPNFVGKIQIWSTSLKSIFYNKYLPINHTGFQIFFKIIHKYFLARIDDSSGDVHKLHHFANSFTLSGCFFL